MWFLLALQVEARVGYGWRLRPVMALALGALLTIVLAGRSDPGRGRKFTVAVGAGATLWSVAAWLVGVPLAMNAALLAGWLFGSGWWWWRLRIRSRFEVVRRQVRLLPEWKWWRERLAAGDSRRLVSDMRTALPPMIGSWFAEQRYRRDGQRRGRPLVEGWRRIAAAAAVSGCKVRRAQWDPVVCRFRLDLRRGQTHADLMRNLARLGSAMPGVNVGQLHLRAQQDGDPMNQAELLYVHGDPLSGPGIPWPYMEKPETTTVRRPITLGPNVLGELIQIHLTDSQHTLVIGLTGAGKSALLNLIIASVARMRDAVLWGIDPAGNVEFGPWAGIFNRLAEGEKDQLAMLLALERIVNARWRRLLTARVRKWDTAFGPFIVLLIDELSQLSPALRRRLTQIVQVGRKCGVRVMVATQHPSKEETGSTLRGQLGRVICLSVNDDAAVTMAFGSDSGLRPRELTLPGTFLMEDPRNKDPQPARCYFLHDDVPGRLVPELAPLRPELDKESAAAEALSAEGARPDRAGADVVVPLRSAFEEREDRAEADERPELILTALLGAEGPLSVRAIARSDPQLGRWYVQAELRRMLEQGKVMETSDGWSLAPRARVGDWRA